MKSNLVAYQFSYVFLLILLSINSSFLLNPKGFISPSPLKTQFDREYGHKGKRGFVYIPASKRIPVAMAKDFLQVQSKSIPILSISLLTVTSNSIFKIMQQKRLPILSVLFTDRSLFTFLMGLTSSLLVSPFFRSLLVNEATESLVWKFVLPVSLILRIIAGNENRTPQPQKKSSILHLPLMIAFLFGSIGSVLAGLITGKLLLPVTSRLVDFLPTLLVGISSLTASYIGGTINFYETGNYLSTILHKENSLLLPRRILDNLNIFAAMDINVMILYFTLLQAVWNKQRLKFRQPMTITENSSDGNRPIIRTNITIMFVPALTMSFAIYWISNTVQCWINFLPGILIALSTIISYLCNSLLEKISFSARIRQQWSSTCNGLSDFFLSIFYFALGSVMNWQILYTQSMTQILLLIGTFLSILFWHFLSLFSLVSIWNRLLRNFPSNLQRNLFIDLDSTLLASNACVGGAATAASMSSTFQRSDLVFSASLAGILGYILGTPLGIFVFHALK